MEHLQIGSSPGDLSIPNNINAFINNVFVHGICDSVFSLMYKLNKILIKSFHSIEQVGFSYPEVISHSTTKS